jgi:hypothetical protein
VALSPRDWAFLYDWEERGVPLDTVVEALAEGPRDARGRARRRRGPITLAAIAPSVEEAWQVLRAGRTAPADPSPPVERGNRVSVWRAALDGLPPGSRLGALLESLLGRLDAGEDRTTLDRDLDAALPGVVEREIVERVEAEVAGSLAPFRASMTEDAFARTRQVAIRDQLRKMLRLPRISSGS